MPQDYSIESSALLKILLHAAAHPAYSINGLLIGRTESKASIEAGTDGLGSPRARQARAAVHIIDALPLFHTSLALAPMTEVGLVQADAYAHSKGLQLVGYYQANEHVADLELGSAGKKVTERIQSHTLQACALLVDNSKLQGFLQEKEESFLQVLVKEGGRAWAVIPPSSLKGDFGSVSKRFLSLHSEGRHHKLVDFDDHLNDLSKSWLNTQLL